MKLIKKHILIFVLLFVFLLITSIRFYNLYELENYYQNKLLKVNDIKEILNQKDNLIFQYKEFINKKNKIISVKNLAAVIETIILTANKYSLNIFEVRFDKLNSIKLSGSFNSIYSFIEEIESRFIIIDEIKIYSNVDKKILNAELLIRNYE